MACNGGVLRGALALLVTAAAGCNTPPATAVPDTGPREDAGPVAQAMVVATDPSTGTTIPADLGCVGSATVPVGGAPLSGPAQFQEFISHANLTGNRVEVFSDNRLAATCDAPGCTVYNTDGSGFITLTLAAGSWFAFRVAESGQTAQVSAFNQPWIASSSETLAVIPVFAPTTITIVGNLIGRTYDPSRFGSMSGRAIDCSNHPLANVRVRVFVDGTEVVTGPIGDRSAPTITGLEGTAPTRTGLTGASGNFVGANILPSASCRVETWATLTAGELPRLIGCAEATVRQGEISISLLGPLRSDYTPGSGCAIAAAAR